MKQYLIAAAVVLVFAGLALGIQRVPFYQIGVENDVYSTFPTTGQDYAEFVYSNVQVNVSSISNLAATQATHRTEIDGLTTTQAAHTASIEALESSTGQVQQVVDVAATNVVTIQGRGGGSVTLVSNILTVTWPAIDYGIDIFGCHAQYSDGDTVTINPGWGYCNTDFFMVSAATNYNLTSIPGSTTNFNYIYIDYDASTFPTNIVFTNTTVGPSLAASSSRYGWYNGEDRIISVVRSTNGAISTFTESAGDYMQIFQSWSEVKLLNNGTANGSYQAPTISVASVTPSNASHAILIGTGEDASNMCSIMFATKEEADFSTNAVDRVGPQLYSRAYDEVGIGAVLPLGPSREVYIAGDANDDAKLNMWCFGWRLYR